MSWPMIALAIVMMGAMVGGAVWVGWAAWRSHRGARGEAPDAERPDR